MKNNKQLAYIIGVIALVAVTSLFYFNNSSSDINASGNTVTGTPVFQVDTEEIKLGEIVVQGDYPANFTVINNGDAPLEISKVRTSCMCTYAEIIIGETKSIEFNMDMDMPNMGTYNYIAARKWKGTIEPGQSATVRVIYKPYLMPVKGSVSRNVKFNTNDPNKPVVELDVHATVK